MNQNLQNIIVDGVMGDFEEILVPIYDYWPKMTNHWMVLDFEVIDTKNDWYGIFWLSKTQNPQKTSMTSCRITFWRFWSLFGHSRAKVGNLQNHSEFSHMYVDPGVSTLTFLIKEHVRLLIFRKNSSLPIVIRFWRGSWVEEFKDIKKSFWN